MTGRYIFPAAAKSAAGISLPDITKAHNRASGFFMRKARPHLRTMVRRAGAPSGAPGSLVSGKANPVRLTTLSISLECGELIQITKEVVLWRQSILPLAHKTADTHNSARKPAANSIAFKPSLLICLLIHNVNRTALCSSSFCPISPATCVTICVTSRKRLASWVCCRTHLKTNITPSQGVLPPLAREMT
ncbi:hypothetical protein DVQ80_02410 [Yersinia enterocolitica]|nr:hypothetical protein [Yersinia enterocolitica]